MANEITVTIDVTCTNGSFSDSFVQRKRIDQAAIGEASGVVSITTSEANLSLSALSANGVCCLLNLDATNFITFGLDDSGTMKAIGKLLPGESAFLRLITGVNLRLKADTATCKLQYMVLNN